MLSAAYDGLHSHAHAHNVTMSDSSTDFTAICETIARQLYNAKITEGTIPKDLYEATADRLMDAVYSGMGKKSFAYEDPNNMLLAHFRHNVFSFSAAKSLTEMKVFNDLLIGADGKLKPFTQYRNDVIKSGMMFNVNHLETDYITAQASAQTAMSFNSFADNEYIQISTTGLEKVCEICGGFEGFTRLKGDKIWNELCPPFHPRCMCKLIPGISFNTTRHTNGFALLKNVDKSFQNNPAHSRVIFTDDYPNMQIFAKGKWKDAKLRWDRDYHMPSLEKIYQHEWQATRPNFATKEEADVWWMKQSNSLRSTFYVTDSLGTVVKFDQRLRVHVFFQNGQERFMYVNNTIDILTDPDEIWTIITPENELKTTYIKYYEDYPYNVQVVNGRVVTWYKYDLKDKLNIASINEDRNGTLLFRK